MHAKPHRTGDSACLTPALDASVASLPNGPESHFPSLSQETPGPLPIKSG